MIHRVLQQHEAQELAEFLTSGAHYPARYAVGSNNHYIEFTRTGDGAVTVAEIVPPEWLDYYSQCDCPRPRSRLRDRIYRCFTNPTRGTL